jgi:alkanesulfonate monooxygenase SsuD/methylene tetrahydromethanopterin reductase-like flavin-dependent oxidoreductase (luciferase family)
VKTAIGVGGPASGSAQEFARIAAFAVEAEKVGVDSAWSAEAWGYDAVSILAYLAAKTQRLVLGSGILQISARAPSMTAMTALALAALSGNRFVLGLGASGPQVVEGLHGVPFASPLARMRETIEIVLLAFRGEPLRYAGQHHVLPLPGGEGKALRLAQPPTRTSRSSSRRSRRRRSSSRVSSPTAGSAPRSRPRPPRRTSRICAGAPSARAARSPTSRSAWAARLRSRAIPSRSSPRRSRAWRSRSARWGPPGRTSTMPPIAAAASRTPRSRCRSSGSLASATRPPAAWPDEMILRTTLIGPESHIRDRLRAYRSAGIGMLRIEPLAKDDSARLDLLGRAVELIRGLD